MAWRPEGSHLWWDSRSIHGPSSRRHAARALDGRFRSDIRALLRTLPSRPVIFAFHGYPVLIHRLTYRQTNHANFHSA